MLDNEIFSIPEALHSKSLSKGSHQVYKVEHYKSDNSQKKRKDSLIIELTYKGKRLIYFFSEVSSQCQYYS